jgi:hypothetical protein
MGYQRQVNKKSSANPDTSIGKSLDSCNESNTPLTQKETKNKQHQKDKFEATKLEIQAKHGTITPEGQERLNLLQAEKADFWQRSLEKTERYGHHLGKISANLSQSLVKGEEKMAADTQPTVIQGYFTFDGQKTNDAGMFPDVPEGANEQEFKRDYVWNTFLKTELDKYGISPKLIAEFKEKLLDIAMHKVKGDFSKIVTDLQEIQQLREKTAKPLRETSSPSKLDPLSSTTPELGDKEKHSNAKYKRKVDGIDIEETFDSDAYTKGPAKRRRGQETVTTPKGEEDQDWNTEGIKNRINTWSCEVPLARHLADYVWQHLKNTDEGKKWELKFREIDRLIDFRDNEAQSLKRKDYTLRARQELKKALLKGEKHPADQQNVLFYDHLLKNDVNPEFQDMGQTTFVLNRDYEASGAGLSMILTHWRPILFFDWILAEDALNNAKDAAPANPQS